MKTLIEKHQQKNERRRRVQFNPEAQAYIQSQLNFVPGMNITSNTSVQQINQQARQNEKVEREIPKTRAEGSYRNVERRRKSGKTKDQEDTERDIKLATQPTWRSDVADALHYAGTGLSTVGGGLALLSNPITTGTALVGGIVGGRAVDKASQNLTGKTWAENVQEKLGLQTPTLAEFTNPGYFIGGGLGLKGKGALNYLIKADMPRFGYTPTTKYYFKPGYLGMNTVPLDKVLNPKLGLKLSDVEHFYKQYGNASTDELVNKGVLKPGPNGDFIVMIDGSPKGSYKNYFLANKKQFIQETPIQQETKPSIKMGEDRTKQLEAGWNKASQDIQGMKSEVSPYIIKQDDPLALTLQQQAQQVRSTQGQIEQPFTNFYLNQNPKQSKLVEKIAEGYDGIPRDVSGNPMIITATDINGNPVNRRDVLLNSVLAYFDKNNASKANYYLTQDQPFMQTFRGSQPRLDPQTLLPKGDTPGVGTKAFGDLNFSTDNLLAAANYSHVLTPEQFLYVMQQMRKQGIPITRQNIDYGMSLVESIMKEQVDKGVKLGQFSKEFRTGLKVPRSSEARGAGETDAKRIPSMFTANDTPNPSEWSNYINNLIRYSRFFGPNQGHGGLRSVMIRRPQAIHKFDVNNRKFDNLGIKVDGKVFNTASDLQKHAAENYWKGIDLYNIKDPLPMNTYGTPQNYYFYGFGMKKGGKLIKRK